MTVCEPSSGGASQALGETCDACPLPQFTEIFFQKNVTDVFTAAPAKRLHYQLRPGDGHQQQARSQERRLSSD
jgi:hypothetical protein